MLDWVREGATAVDTITNAIYQVCKSTDSCHAVDSRFETQLRQGNFSVSDFQHFVEANVPELIKNKSYKGKTNACVRVKHKTQKYHDGFRKIVANSRKHHRAQ